MLTLSERAHAVWHEFIGRNNLLGINSQCMSRLLVDDMSLAFAAVPFFLLFLSLLRLFSINESICKSICWLFRFDVRIRLSHEIKIGFSFILITNNKQYPNLNQK